MVALAKLTNAWCRICPALDNFKTNLSVWNLLRASFLVVNHRCATLGDGIIFALPPSKQGLFAAVKRRSVTCGVFFRSAIEAVSCPVSLITSPKRIAQRNRWKATLLWCLTQTREVTNDETSVNRAAPETHRNSSVSKRSCEVGEHDLEKIISKDKWHHHLTAKQDHATTVAFTNSSFSSRS